MWLLRIGHRRSCGQGGPVSDQSNREDDKRKTHLVVGRHHLVTDGQLTLSHVSNVQHVTVEDLDLLDDKVGLAINDDTASVVLLSSRLGVEVGVVEDETEGFLGGSLGGRFVELARVVDGLDGCIDVSETWGRRG